VASWALIEEVVAVMRRPKLRRRYDITESDVAELVVLLSLALPTVEYETPVRDPKDAPVIAAALSGNADVIVTGDDDLLADAGLRAWLDERGVEVIKATELLRRLS
jgi:uncharacterized protein